MDKIRLWLARRLSALSSFVSPPNPVWVPNWEAEMARRRDHATNRHPGAFEWCVRCEDMYGPGPAGHWELRGKPLEEWKEKP